MEWLKDIIKTAVFLEKKTTVGILNQKWAAYTFLAWLIVFIGGFAINYIPLKNTNPLDGFSLELKNPTPYFLTVVMILVLPACITGLIICYKKGWIKKI